VELSVSESFAEAAEPTSSLEHWATAVSTASEPCLVVDSISMIVAASPAACTLLGFDTQADAVGRHLAAGVLRLLDFTSAGAPLPDSEMEKIPPVLAYSSGRLARGLLRVQSGAEVRTVDAIASPLFDGRKVVGSLTFFSQI
jgi:PAS domain-containing protein